MNIDIMFRCCFSWLLCRIRRRICSTQEQRNARSKMTLWLSLGEKRLCLSSPTSRIVRVLFMHSRRLSVATGDITPEELSARPYSLIFHITKELFSDAVPCGLVFHIFFHFLPDVQVTPQFCNRKDYIFSPCMVTCTFCKQFCPFSFYLHSWLLTPRRKGSTKMQTFAMAFLFLWQSVIIMLITIVIMDASGSMSGA